MKNTQLKNYIDKGFCIVKLFKKDIINIKITNQKLKLLDKKIYSRV